jgi:hypothetical protein
MLLMRELDFMGAQHLARPDSDGSGNTIGFKMESPQGLRAGRQSAV